MVDKTLVEKNLRRFTLEKLKALADILAEEQNVLTTTTLSGTLDLKGQDLGARVSSLTRTQIDGEPLLIPVGRSSRKDVLWRLNEAVATKEDLKLMVSEILAQNEEFRLAQK